MSTILKDIARESAREMRDYITNIEFRYKFLSKETETHTRYGANQYGAWVVIAPRKYDTARYIRELRQSGGIYTRIIPSGNTSYASDLNARGSEIQVYKRKKNIPQPYNSMPMHKIPTKYLTRTIIRPRNHKYFVENALRKALYKVALSRGGTITKWQVKN